MKKILVVFGVCALSPSLALCAEEETTKLVYPAPAAEIELDNSTPAKRITPPIREESELDPVTPIGQIRAVKDSLDRLEAAQEDIRAELRKSARTLSDDEGFLSRFNSIFPLLEKNAENGEETKKNVGTLLKASDGIGAKIDALAKTTENLRATVEAAQKTAASVERIRTSRWTDFAVIAILALVLLQLVGKVGAFIVTRISATRSRLAELSEAYAIAKKELEKKQTKESKVTK